MSKLRTMSQNPNKGVKGNGYISKSLQELGAARSIVASADNEIIAGNHVFVEAQKLGLSTRVVETDGSELVVVKRTDVQSGTEKAMAIAIADNRAGEISLRWDNAVLAEQYDIAIKWEALKPFDVDEVKDLLTDEVEAPKKRVCPHCGLPLNMGYL